MTALSVEMQPPEIEDLPTADQLNTWYQLDDASADKTCRIIYGERRCGEKADWMCGLTAGSHTNINTEPLCNRCRVRVEHRRIECVDCGGIVVIKWREPIR